MQGRCTKAANSPDSMHARGQMTTASSSNAYYPRGDPLGFGGGIIDVRGWPCLCETRAGEFQGSVYEKLFPGFHNSISRQWFRIRRNSRKLHCLHRSEHHGVPCTVRHQLMYKSAPKILVVNNKVIIVPDLVMRSRSLHDKVDALQAR